MAATLFYRGQQLGRTDLNIFIDSQAGTPTDVAEIFYGLYDFTTGQEVPIGSEQRVPLHPSKGEYYASLVIPLDANIGSYRVRWRFRETVQGPINRVVQEFTVIDKPGLSTPTASAITGGVDESSDVYGLMGRLRILLRDNNPDRNYRFQPPAHEETVQQFNRVFGYIWEDVELVEYLERSLDSISASPPRTPFSSIESMLQFRPEWRTLLLTGAMSWALNALRICWISSEFNYSIGGISLDLEKSSKYESAYSAMSEQFTTQLEAAKQTVKVIKGLQQPRYGMGIRSSFGPYVGRGVVTPAKFIGF